MKRGFDLILHWFRFGGRMGRGDYNSVNLVALLLLLASNVIFVLPLFTMKITGPVGFATIPLGWNAWVAGVLFTAAMWIAVSSTVRRLHDFGWSGWWLALVLSPLRELALFAGLIGLAILGLAKGARGANRYGEKTTPNQLL